MKKYIAGFLAGALFTIAGAAFADDIQSLIGKKIQGEAVVELNGQALDTAIIVDGKSYAPVRAIGEAAGYDVSMQNKKIILGEKATATTPGKGSIVEDESKIKEIIASHEESIKREENRIASYEKLILERPNDKEAYQAVIDTAKANIAKYKQWIAEREAQLTDLK